jgi:hypothetical protein
MLLHGAVLYPGRTDRSLQSTLNWALERMKEKGYIIKSRVSLAVDPNLSIMGYAKKEGEAQKIVISEWALDSEMLGGLVLHELAHIYFTESGSPSHDTAILEEALEEFRKREGLREREAAQLVDAFNHLQNIIVDDIVFDVMQEKEREMAKKFFAEWVSARPSGDPVLDASLLCRNAFAIASLRRRGLFDEDSEMASMNRNFLSVMGRHAVDEFEWLVNFLEKGSADCSEEEFRRMLVELFDRMLSLMRSSAVLRDLR